MIAPSRALIVMTPMTASRLGRARDELVQAAFEAFERTDLCVLGERESLRERIAAFDPDLVVAAGGDGTVNLALQAMREHDTLAVVPLGTANDLARCLGVTRNPRLLGSFVLDSTRQIDVLRVNGQRFCTTGGLGLPAEVAHRVNTLREGGRHWMESLGSHLYPTVAAQLCTRGAPLCRLELACEEGRRSVETHGVFVTNQATFAGRLCVVEDADNTDGSFELCVLGARGRCELLRLLGRIVRHRVRPGELVTLRTRRAVLRADRELRFFGDGEVLCRASEFVIEVDPGGLRVCC